MFLEAYGTPATRAATRASRSWFEGVGVDGEELLTPRPLLVVAGPGRFSSLEHHERSCAEAGLTLRRLDAVAARARVPALRAGWVEAALEDPDAAEIDVAASLRRFVTAARAAGASIRLRCAPERLVDRGGAWLIDTADEAMHARVVVNAAGAWADQVAGLAGVAPIGLEPRRRTACTVDVPDGVDASRWPFVLDADERFYLKPEGPQLLLSPADETPDHPGDARPEEIDVALALERVDEATTLGLRSVRSAWAGLRSFAPDGDPVIGEDPTARGFVWCAGQGGTGIQSAPAIAELVADAVFGALDPSAGSGAHDPSAGSAAGLPAGALCVDRLRGVVHA